MCILRKYPIIAKRHGSLLSLLFLLLVLFFMEAVFPVVGVSAKEASPTLNLTESERAWLSQHPTIRMGIMNAWPPMDYVDKMGRPRGIGVEFIGAFNKRLDNRIEIVPGPWSETYKAVKEKKLDALMDITPLPSRQEFFHFTEPYMEVPHLIFTRKNAPEARSLADLAGMTVGVEKGFYIINVFRNRYPRINVREYTTTSDVLDALSKGEVDAYIGNRAGARYIIENELITNIKAQGKISETSSINAIGVRKDWPILQSILQKVLDDISPQEHLQLINPFPRIESLDRSAFTNSLSQEERTWLSNQTEIHIGVMDAWPPMSYVDKGGIAQGIGLDYLAAINKRIGDLLVPEPAPFKQNYDKVKHKQLDGIMDITPKPERAPFFEFSIPYMSIPHVFVGRKDGPYYDSAQDLNGRIVALEKGYYNVKIFQNEYPQVTVKEYPATADALEAVSRGEADAYAGNRVVAMYLIEQELLFNLAVQGRMDAPPVKLNIGVRKDWPILARIIDRAIADISPDEARQIHTRWVGELKKVDQGLTLQLSKEERSWLDNHSTVHLGVDQGWPPVEWIDEQGHYQGVASEYIGLITDMLGLQVAPVERMFWTEVLERARRGEVDMLPALVASPERSGYLNFTSPYLSFPFVIFTRENAPFITEIRDLYGKLVAVEEGHVSYEYLQRDHPKIKLMTYKTTHEILQALSLGDVEAYVGNLTVASYLMKKSGYTNIKVAAPTPYNFDLSIGVRQDWPEMIPILEKALSMIDEEQRNQIRQKWLTLNYELGVDYKLVKRIAIGAGIFIFFVLLWVIFVYRKERMLQEAKAETDKANEAYQLANNQLLQANIKLKEMDKMKSMFIASISHELRTPLNSIIGFSGMMMQGTFGDLNEKYQDYTMRVNRSGKHLLELITDIIDISKIEAGRVDIMADDFKLDEIVCEAVEGLGQQIERKGVSLKVDYPKDVAMHTDRRRLYQCLLNILSNAMKYTEKGEIVLTAKEQEQEVLLTVQDTGIGISEADQVRLFEAFERMDSHLKIKAGGTGLGLYLTKKIVTDLLQGDVGVESKPGEGSSFWIRVPKRIDPQKIKVSQGGGVDDEYRTCY
jgi:ABC-type amino acid transport substrate-binding protein/nitrogen-specific signal transduction histidine kinase